MCTPISEMKDRDTNVILFYLKVRDAMYRRHKIDLPLWYQLPHHAKLAYQVVVDLNKEAMEQERAEWRRNLTVTGDYGII